MNPILKTKYTLSTEFVLAQVRGNNHWRTSQVRLEILNDRTLILGYMTSSQHLSGTQFFLSNVLKLNICIIVTPNITWVPSLVHLHINTP
jgi:hypothetical protein